MSIFKSNIVSHINAADYLKKKGYELLGSGMFSQVLAKPGSDRCIKVGRNDGWPKYILWAHANGYLGTYAPMVYSIKGFDGWYMASMERLVTTVSQCRRDNAKFLGCEASVIQELHYNLKEAVQYQINFKNCPEGWQEFAEKIRLEHIVDDCHDGNWMLRKDGHMVLIDPSSTGHNVPKRFRSSTTTQPEGE